MDGAKTGRASAGGMVRSLYEAAMREVKSDPVAAVTKYQPDWLPALHPRPAPGRGSLSPPKG